MPSQQPRTGGKRPACFNSPAKGVPSSRPGQPSPFWKGGRRQGRFFPSASGQRTLQALGAWLPVWFLFRCSFLPLRQAAAHTLLDSALYGILLYLYQKALRRTAKGAENGGSAKPPRKNNRP